MTILIYYLNWTQRNSEEESFQIGIEDYLKVIYAYFENSPSLLKKNSLLRSNYCIVKPLTYYSKDQLTLGSLEHLQTTHIQEVEHKGAYSIYFIVIKADLHRRLDYSLYHFLHIKKTDLFKLRPDYSHYRFLHDEIIIE